MNGFQPMPKNILTIILSIIIVILAIFVDVKQVNINELQNQISVLKNKPVQTVTVHDTDVIYTTADTIKTVVHVNKPPEGSVTVNLERYNQLMSTVDKINTQLKSMQYKVEHDTVYHAEYVVTIDSLKTELNANNNLLSNPEKSGVISIQKYGRILKLGIGAGYGNTGLSPVFNTKLFFYKQYGIGIAGTNGLAGISIQRHLNDIWNPLRNLEVIFVDGISYKTMNNAMFIGFAVSL
jgi:hypothetical protein